MYKLIFSISLVILYIVIIGTSKISCVVNGKDMSSYFIVGAGFLVGIYFLQTLFNNFYNRNKRREDEQR